MRLSSFVWPVVSLTLTGCLEFGEGDAKIPGEPLGRYQVVATLQTSSCGPGALGASDVWEFEVQLSRDGDDLFWLNGREVIPGRIASDGSSFSFETRVDVQAAPAGGPNAGCTISRVDAASGSLNQGSEHVDTFDGQLRYGFVPQVGSECGGLVGVPGGFQTLPCDIAYSIQGTRLGDVR